MKVILMLDKADQDRMRNGAMVQIPGQLETYITMEQKKTYRPRVSVDRPAIAFNGKSHDPRFKCKYCGDQRANGPGRASHERSCAKNPQHGMKKRKPKLLTHEVR